MNCLTSEKTSLHTANLNLAGIDSQEALEKRFPAFRDAAQTRAQLINGFSKLRDWAAKLLTGQDRAIPIGGSKTKRSRAGTRGATAAEGEEHESDSAAGIMIAASAVLPEASTMQSPMKIPLEDRSFCLCDAIIPVSMG